MGAELPFGRWNSIFPNWPNQIAINPRLEGIVSNGPKSLNEIEAARGIDRLPKIELHVHLEAGVSTSFYERLNQETSRFEPGNLPSQRAPFPNFMEFIRGWVDQTLLIRSPRDLYEMAKEFVRCRKLQNIVYTEAHISPADFCMIRARLNIPGPVFDFSECLEAYLAGVRDAQRETPGHLVRLIVDCLWPSLAKERDIFLPALRRVVDSPLNRDFRGDPIIVGVGLGGPEISHEAEQIKPFLDKCRDLGLKIDIHSGEMTDAPSHRHAVETIAPDRVGHGFKGAEIGFFAPCPIVTCPLSNLMTGAWGGEFMDHPIKEMAHRNLCFSVGSDDPLLFGNSLTLEYLALANAFGWGNVEFRKILENSAKSAFLPQALARVWS